MTVCVYAEENFLPEDYGCWAESDGSDHVSTLSGTFSLRRVHYFTETGEPLLSAEQQQVLTNLIREGVPAAKPKMIVHSLRLVINIAKRYTNRGLGLFELAREGNQGLIHALEKFEPEVSFRFSAYATQCIRQYIERAITDQDNCMSIGASPVISSQARPSLVPVVSLQRVA